MPRRRKVCVHRWVLGAPAQVVSGRCSLCGEEREFDNSEVEVKFRSGVNVGRGNQIVLRPRGWLEPVARVNDGWWSWTESKPMRRIL